MSEAQNLELGSAYFVQYHKGGFGTYDPRDEELHPEICKEKPHYALTETQYYGFYVPEADLHCFTWVWYHPNLNALESGTMAWRGFKPINLACELFDFRGFMSGEVFAKTFTDFTLDSGLSITMTEPGKTWRLRYEDKERGNGFDVVQQAVTEPLVWPTSNHFEQTMHCTGRITLRGEAHAVDCYSVRDRSFGEYRLEDPMGIPPNSWTTGAFGPDLSFTVVGMEDETLDPIWKGKFAIPPGSLLRFGWLVVDGEKCVVTQMNSKIDYDREHLLPRAMYLKLTDEHGRVHEFHGRVRAATPLTAWLNVRCPICMIEWNYNGRIGHGEIQNVQFNDFLHLLT